MRIYVHLHTAYYTYRRQTPETHKLYKTFTQIYIYIYTLCAAKVDGGVNNIKK